MLCGLEVVFADCGSLLGLRLLCDCWLIVAVWMFGLWLCGCVGGFCFVC